MNPQKLPVIGPHSLRERTGHSVYLIHRAIKAGKIPQPGRLNGLFWAESDLPTLKAVLDEFEKEGKVA